MRRGGMVALAAAIVGLAVAALAQTPVIGPWSAISTNVNLLAGSIIATYNGISTAGQGAPIIVVVADRTAQAANFTDTSLYAVPAGQGGTYRLNCYVVVTQAATTSSTMPRCLFAYTDNETGHANTDAWATNTLTTNTVGTNSTQAAALAYTLFNAAPSTTIYWATNGYLSSGTTPMNYSIHAKLEYLGQ